MKLELVHSNSSRSVESKNRALMKWRDYKLRYKDMRATYNYQSSECSILRFYDKRKLKSKWNSFLVEIDNTQYNKLKKQILPGPMTAQKYPAPEELYYLSETQLTLYMIFYSELMEYLEISNDHDEI